MERIVVLDQDSRRFSFTIDHRECGMSFWRVTSEDRVYLSPLRVSGAETPEFFKSLARTAVEIHGL